jgi:hypothetical protein
VSVVLTHPKPRGSAKPIITGKKEHKGGGAGPSAGRNSTASSAVVGMCGAISGLEEDVELSRNVIRGFTSGIKVN